MTIFEHIGELRTRLIICLAAVVIGAILAYLFYDQIFHFLTHPYCQAFPSKGCRTSLVITTPLSGFSARLDVCAYGGVIFGGPVIIYELWQFVTPGLRASEKRYALPFVFATVILFFLGALTAYVIFPHGLKWLVVQSGPGVRQLITVQSYISLLSLLMLVFGAAFEYPAVLVGLELAGVISTAALRKFRRFAFLIVVVVSAVVTPSSDPFSMLALCIPLTLFYEGSIIVGRLLGK